MKKLLVLFSLLCMALPCFATNPDYIELFEKTYLNVNRIDVYKSLNVVSFWIKSLNKNPKDKANWFAKADGSSVQWWYTLGNIQIDCKNRKSRTATLAIYDLKGMPLDTSDNITEWNTIIPDTYADAYYNLFCLVPYDENPLINKELRNK